MNTTRYPAEWEPQAATWLAWPHNPLNWSARQEGIENFYDQLIRWIARFQPVCLLVPPDRRIPQSFLLAWSQLPHPVLLHNIATNDIWIRDYGPFFMDGPRGTYCVKFEFNAWGAKFPPWDHDNKVPQHIARLLGFDLTTYSPILEGGAMEFNGHGIALTTLDCLVGANRNSTESLVRLREMLVQVFGLQDLLVLPQGLIGDHTDGHIDNLVRFIGPGHLLTSREEDPHATNYEILRETRERLLSWMQSRPEIGWKLDELPLPPQRQMGTEILPASYMNFIYANGAILLPIYHCDSDAEALKLLRRRYPDRVVEGIDCSLVIEEGGSLHCMSKQQPV